MFQSQFSEDSSVVSSSEDRSRLARIFNMSDVAVQTVKLVIAWVLPLAIFHLIQDLYSSVLWEQCYLISLFLYSDWIMIYLSCVQCVITLSNVVLLFIWLLHIITFVLSAFFYIVLCWSVVIMSLSSYHHIMIASTTVVAFACLCAHLHKLIPNRSPYSCCVLVITHWLTLSCLWCLVDGLIRGEYNRQCFPDRCRYVVRILRSWLWGSFWGETSRFPRTHRAWTEWSDAGGNEKVRGTGLCCYLLLCDTCWLII